MTLHRSRQEDAADTSMTETIAACKGRRKDARSYSRGFLANILKPLSSESTGPRLFCHPIRQSCLASTVPASRTLAAFSTKDSGSGVPKKIIEYLSTTVSSPSVGPPVFRAFIDSRGAAT